MKRTGNLVLTALLALLGFVILIESNDNKIDIKIADNENLNVKDIKNVTAVAETKGSGKKVKTVIIEFDKTIKNPKLSKSEVTVTQKRISRKNSGKNLDEQPALVTTETKKVKRGISEIYTSDKMDENGKAEKVKDGKYLYLELADSTDNSSKELHDSDLESLKISISQDKDNYFTNSKSFNKTMK
ncbi:hypothetical protein [Leptotrichia alba]|uniref:Esterase Ig-like N-terminal domain-containing protein n=1 Tax=Leptotrichia alba TaxID=3239304 RepID=A0AB39V6C9_9FUSO